MRNRRVGEGERDEEQPTGKNRALCVREEAARKNDPHFTVRLVRRGFIRGFAAFSSCVHRARSLLASSRRGISPPPHTRTVQRVVRYTRAAFLSVPEVVASWKTSFCPRSSPPAQKKGTNCASRTSFAWRLLAACLSLPLLSLLALLAGRRKSK